MALEEMVVHDLKMGVLSASVDQEVEDSANDESELFTRSHKPSSFGHIVTIDPADCNDTMLESMDECVGCVEDVRSQHEFEASVGTKELIDELSPIHQQSLGPTEAAMIRHQLMDSTRHRGQEKQKPFDAFSDIDVLNICGSDVGTKSAGLGRQPQPAATADESLCNKNDDTETDKSFACAVCEDKSTETRSITFCQFPCCSDESGIRVCSSCLLVSTTPTADGGYRIGHCLRCRNWIRVTAPISPTQQQLEITLITLGEPTFKCQVCQMHKMFLIDERECDACFIGQRHALLYECQACQCVQRIPHPLYRSQATPDSFGTVKWACQGRACGGFSHWRVLPEQVALIPVGDAPASWDVDPIIAARRRLAEARQSMVAINAEDFASNCPIL